MSTESVVQKVDYCLQMHPEDHAKMLATAAKLGLDGEAFCLLAIHIACTEARKGHSLTAFANTAAISPHGSNANSR